MSATAFGFRRLSRHSRKNRVLRAEVLESRTLTSVNNPLGCSIASAGALDRTAAAAVAAAQPVVLSDNADTAIQNGSSSYSNFGGYTYMAVGKDTMFGTECQSYLRFSLGSVGEKVNSAVLKLAPLSWTSNTAAVALRVRLVPDAGDNWAEGTNGYNYNATGPMTWANSPIGAGAAITVPASQWPSTGPISIDVTSLLSQSFNANGIATFQIDLLPSYGSQSWMYFATRENSTADYRPTLAVTAASTNVAPSVAAPASASPGAVTDTTTMLSVLGDDDGGEGNLTYTWSTTSAPSGAAAPTFNVNGTNAAKQATVTFGKAGTYTFTAKITDADGLSVTSDVTVVVNSMASGVAVSPANATLALGTTQQFSAAAVDQFGAALATQPTFTWKTTAGSISAKGLFTAPKKAGSATITAVSGSIQGTTTVTVGSSLLGLKDAALESLAEKLFGDGSINRLDMIQILRSVGSDDNKVDATEIGDLKTILNDASMLKIPGYVQVLAGDVVKGNTANAHFQGKPLGNLAAGNSSTQLSKLVDKWFLGTDHPGADANVPAGATYTYKSASGTLFVGGPSHTDELQGQLGDCYFISSLGSVGDRSAAAIQNMFVDNGDNTWTVRFYANGTADYVTVDRMLPTDASGRLVYADVGHSYSASANELWIPLAEKAYAQWNETGKEGRDGKNLYSSIEGGWMADVYAQVLGHSATSYNVQSTSDQNALISAMNKKLAVTIGTLQSSASDDSLAYGLYGSHAYAVVGYNSAKGTFTLYNPWGTNEPTGPLTWAQLKATCDGFAVADPAGTTPISSLTKRRSTLVASLTSSMARRAGAIDEAFRFADTDDLPVAGRPNDVTPASAANRALAFGSEASWASTARDYRSIPLRREPPSAAADESLRLDFMQGGDHFLPWSGGALSLDAPVSSDALCDAAAA